MADLLPAEMRPFCGIISSLNTPMTEGGQKLDLASVPRLIDHCVAAGCCGCLVAAVAGEQASLSVEEHEQLVSSAVDANSGRLRLVVACSAADQDSRIRRAQLCSRLGVECVCVQVPGEAKDAAQRMQLLSDVAEAALPAVLMLQDLDFAGPGLAVNEIVSIFESIELPMHKEKEEKMRSA
jgi:4-hydroxy-tetrahydrodipicolinate synthase